MAEKDTSPTRSPDRVDAMRAGAMMASVLLLFAAPLLSFTAVHVSLGGAYVHFLMLAWAYTSLAYLAALLTPNNAVRYLSVAKHVHPPAVVTVVVVVLHDLNHTQARG
mgnify:CR=1 FL=1